MDKEINEIKENAVFQKKHWISITGLCNNNCRFCLDGHRPDKKHKNKDEILKELKKAYEGGARKAIISGGDPTIHPDFMSIIKETKELGYDKVQVISNGRMFSSFSFLEKAVAAGLGEITFSLHGHTAEIHDGFTQVPGSFKQIIKGIRNALSVNGLIVNTDTVITAKNYMHLKDIFFLLYHLGIREMNLMSLVLNGNAYENRTDLMYDLNEATPYVKEVIDLSKKNNVVFWLSRYSPEYLEGYEEFVEDPYKMVDDVKGMWKNVFANSEVPHCKGVRCDYCGIRLICPSILEAKKKLNYKNDNDKKNKSIIKLDKNIYNITDVELGILFSVDSEHVIELPSPNEKLSEYAKKTLSLIEIRDLLIRILDIARQNKVKLSFRGLPICCFDENNAMLSLSLPDSLPSLSTLENEKDYLDLARELAANTKIKPLKCKDCIYFSRCPGIFLQYFRLKGSSELIPSYAKEIRINLECNQNCLFCNTDEGAENVITEKEKIFLQLEEWKKNNVQVLIVSGREPTLSPDLKYIIQKASDLNYNYIQLQTNATLLIDEEKVKSLKDAGLDSAFVSLHAHNDALSTKITNAPGTFEKTVQGIKNLLSANIDVTINLVINSFNYKFLPEIVEFINTNFIKSDSDTMQDSKAHISKLVFSYVSPICAAWKNKEIIPKYADVKPFLENAIEQCKKHGIDINIPERCGLPFCFLGNNMIYSDGYQQPLKWHNENDKSKVDKCDLCILKYKCTGLWDNYIELYGSDEIVPLREIQK